MKTVIFASGSGGNCLLLSDGGTHILIDAGISRKRIEASLSKAGLAANGISGVFITHEHSDHISGLNMLLKYNDIPVYAPHTVAARITGACPSLEGRISIIKPGVRNSIGSLNVTAFHTPHDTDESVGYRVEGSSVFAMATDMGHVTEEVIDGLSGARTVLIEANHDIGMLLDGPYPVQLKRRILSDRGHLSNADCAKLAAYLAEHGTENIILGHLSRENNSPDAARAEAAAALAGRNVGLYCAPQSGFLCVETEEMEKCCL